MEVHHHHHACMLALFPLSIRILCVCLYVYMQIPSTGEELLLRRRAYYDMILHDGWHLCTVERCEIP